MDLDDYGLTIIPRTKRDHTPNESWSFGDSDVQEAFKRVYSPEKSYVLFQTIANKEAVETLKQYVGFRERMGSPWVVQKIESADSGYVPGVSDRNNRLKFNNNLMDTYQRAIDQIAKTKLNRNNFSHYPQVKTFGVHNMDRDPQAIFWPRTYLVSDKNADNLKKIIDGLSGKDSFELLTKLESPQYYRMAEIETLHHLDIAPIVRLERELHLGAKDLSTYIDFLTQMTYTCRLTGDVIDDD